MLATRDTAQRGGATTKAEPGSVTRGSSSVTCDPTSPARSVWGFLVLDFAWFAVTIAVQRHRRPSLGVWRFWSEIVSERMRVTPPNRIAGANAREGLGLAWKSRVVLRHWHGVARRRRLAA